MKQRIGIIMILSIVIAVLSVAPIYRTALGEIADAYVAENGEIYYLKDEEDGSKTLFHLAQDGTILLELSLSGNKDGQQTEVTSVIADSIGNCYVRTEVKKEEDMPAAVYIQIYDPNGKELDRIFYFEEEEQNGEEHSALRGGTKYENEFIAFHLTDDRNYIQVLRYDLETKEELEPYKYPLNSRGKDHFEEYIYAGADAVFLINYRGEMLRLTKEGPRTITLSSSEEETVIPYISSASEGSLYFTDGRKFQFCKLDPVTETLQILYEKESPIGKGILFSKVRNVRMQEDRLTAYHSKEYNGIHSFILSIETDGTIQQLQYKQMEHFQLLSMFFLRLFVAAVILSLGYYLCWKLWHARSLMVKLILLILPLMAALSFFLSYYLKNSYTEIITEESYDQLYLAVYAALNRLEPERYQEIQPPIGYGSVDYDELDDILSVLNYLNQKVEKESGGLNKELYLTFYSIQNQEAYITLDLDTDFRHGGHMRSGVLEELTEPAGDYVRWFLDRDYVEDRQLSDSSDNSEWMYYAKVIGNEKEVYGYVEAGLNKKELLLQISLRCRKLSAFVILAVFGVMLVIFLGIGSLMKNLKKLKNGVTAVSSGNWGTMVDIISRDEMQDIGNSFNRMSDQIVQYFQSIEQLSHAYEQFTPKQLLELLDRDSVLDAVPGSYTVKQMSFLFITLGSLIEQAEFSEVNQWIGNITAEVSSRGGVMESFQGAELQAIFSGSVEAALEAAAAILQQFSKIETSYAATEEIGIIIQNGEMTFGIVGDETRRSTMLIAEAVNQSYFLRQFAIKNRIPVLVTEDAVQCLTRKKDFLLRRLGKLRKGSQSQEWVEVYELCDACSPEVRILRKQTEKLFEEGIDCYQAGAIEQARRKFIDVIRMDSTDETAKMYLFLCDHYSGKIMLNWEGLIG